MLSEHPKTVLLVACVVLAIAAVAIAIWARSRTYHFRVVDDGKLYRDGCRTRSQFLASCQRGKIKTVISLVGNDEIGNERFGPILAACRERGVQLKHVPVHISAFPSDEDVQQFLTIATDSANQPALVHCREGIRRTGMMTAAYQMSVLGYSKEKALGAIESFGHSQRTIADIQTFINSYDPARRTLNYPPGLKAVGVD